MIDHRDEVEVLAVENHEFFVGSAKLLRMQLNAFCHAVEGKGKCTKFGDTGSSINPP